MQWPSLISFLISPKVSLTPHDIVGMDYLANFHHPWKLGGVKQNANYIRGSMKPG